MNATSTSSQSAGLYLSVLLKHAVVDATSRGVGELSDGIIRLRGEQYPLLTGLTVKVGQNPIFVPISDVSSIDSARIELSTPRPDLRPFERRAGEVLLRADVLGHRLIDVDRAVLVRAYDVELIVTPEGWVVAGLDVHKHRWLHLGGRHERHPSRDWRSFEALIGHQPSLLTRSPSGRLRRLRAAQIADLIEEATAVEQDELLAHVHDDPELEADVFEELDDDRQARLLKSRTVKQVADVLTRMRADDAADAVMDLPQDRRQGVLDLLPEPQRTKVLTLLGYHDATAGGLMGTDFLAVDQDSTIEQAVTILREAKTAQPEALTTFYSIDDHGRLVGAIGLVRALQKDHHLTLREVADPHPVHAGPADDLIEVTMRMADFNLFTLPVVDADHKILGVITVDDALEAAIPQDWRRREPRYPSTTTQATSAGGQHS